MSIAIGDRTVGPGHPIFVIAEAGVNHNGDVAVARRLVDAAVGAGADAIKFQTFAADRLATQTAPKADYQKQTTDTAESQYDMLRRLELAASAYEELSDYSRQRGILFLSSPFDENSADLLEKLDVPAFKIASGEITNLPFLSHVAAKGKPMIVSTGMSTLSEIEIAVDTIRAAGNETLVLLQCVSQYPADPAVVNLRAIGTLAGTFGVPAGYSDHTLGTVISIAAAAVGASVIEKHLTLDRQLLGPDHQASIEPDEFAAMVRDIRTVERALGDGQKQPVSGEAGVAAVARKSLVAARALRAGALITEDALAVRRPGTGLPPSMRATIVGRHLARDVVAGTPILPDMLA